mmetsp:Transcript_22260/g.22432  ORF Transcript_22260/g.22432 Transcript_22260/m.22432 type:complete len:487 (+) Transcript_22260:144-1604(+)|eukprot:CAMPEP_0182424244 /NCGR_PEP_ID=MMETSP1167-20130531/10408_1 /TAXON_ID=2988 /ORGANISM="Mallomonas Sp, Strain CCMP3275" /LENGTH=486 /DNA_ID=CAMNT_0024603891 /DNA_START=78 /DNA_END=1541 /DNA_ORIENTATION=+
MGQSLSKGSKRSDDTNAKKTVYGRREIGVALIILYYRLIIRLLKRYNIDVPPVLVSLLGVIGGLEVLKKVKGKETAAAVVDYLDPAADWLGFWMPLWLAPPLVVLPNALLSVKEADTQMWIKLALVHFVSWAATVWGSSKLYSAMTMSSEEDSSSSSLSLSPPSPPPSLSSDEKLTDKDTEREREAKTESSAAEDTNKTSLYLKKIRLLRFWGVVAAGFYGLAVTGVVPPSPALATVSIAAQCSGDLLPARVKQVVHPVIVTAVISAIATLIMHYVRKDPGNWQDALRSFFNNGKLSGRETEMMAGDLFFSFLGPCCVGLALRIHTLLQLPEMQEALPAVLGTSFLSSLLSLLLSPLFARVVGLPSEIASVLGHRSITTSLAVPSAISLGASAELTVAAVLISGLYGTSPDTILNSLGIAGDHLASGVSLGMSSHSLGTASLLSVSSTAAAAASLTMFSAGMFHAILCSVPAVRHLALLSAGTISP